MLPGNKDWGKIHQRQFDKMESIDVYYAKKRKRIESLSTSMKKVKMMTEQMRSALTSLKKHKTPPSIQKVGCVQQDARWSPNAAKAMVEI